MWENSFTLYNIYIYIVAGVTSCTSQTICKKKFLFFTQNTSSQLQSTMAANITPTSITAAPPDNKSKEKSEKSPDAKPQNENQKADVHDTVTNGPQNNVAGDGNQNWIVNYSTALARLIRKHLVVLIFFSF